MFEPDTRILAMSQSGPFSACENLTYPGLDFLINYHLPGHLRNKYSILEKNPIFEYTNMKHRIHCLDTRMPAAVFPDCIS
ncbi:hypothetical protein OpiT1DRAFT_03374 [Opitutaceae bacterium TAV1]|nr:hypothetical protein OpiT1DRAFT_03374 [Opitutaceae bacterium TAV1]